MNNTASHYHFAYGSNMNLTQIKKRCSSPKVVAIARLSGYKIGFYGDSAIWDSAQETVVPDAQGEVWGVVYELQSFDCEGLDTYQDVRFDGTGPYFHYPVEVIDGKGRTYDAELYKKNILQEAQLPSTEYLNFIVQSAIEQGLPPEYIACLQEQPSKPASYSVPLAQKSRLSYVDCGDCG